MVRGTELVPLHKLSVAEREARFASDISQVQIHHKGLREVIKYMDSRTDLFPREPLKESRLLRREEKEIAWNTWQRFMDYLVALDSVEQYHSQYYRLKGQAREDSYLINSAAMLGRYRAALEFIERTENNPELHKVLNDPVPELGLPGRTYARLKYKHLNFAIATEFSARQATLKTFKGERQPALRKLIEEDADFLWKAGRSGRGGLLTTKNAMKIVEDTAQNAWLPVQTGVSEWMGHTKVNRLNKPLISLKQLRECQSRLAPGDILLQRREWYLSNIGLPGFWSHAALYIGTPEERSAFFHDAETRAWLETQDKSAVDLDALLRSRFPEACERMLAHHDPPLYEGQPDPTTDPVRIIEAIGEGVSFHSLEHSAACDSMVVLRPRLSKAEKAQALLRSFAYAGRPYDFDFDFSTDAALVCTELVYKSYEPSAGRTGLKLQTVEMLGRQVTPANEFARQFDVEFDTPGQQFDMVFFLDGKEREKKAVEASVAEFRETWKRPKWHVFVQKSLEDGETSSESVAR